MVDEIAAKAGITKAAAKAALEAFINATVKTVKKGGKVSIPGFFTCMQVKRSARNGVNPATGANIKIPAKKAPKFKVGATFKEAVA